MAQCQLKLVPKTRLWAENLERKIMIMIMTSWVEFGHRVNNFGRVGLRVKSLDPVASVFLLLLLFF